MSDAFLTVDEVSKRFAPHLTLGDRIAARLGGAVETRAVQAVERGLAHDRARRDARPRRRVGCGKSTLGRVIAGILMPSQGRVLLDGAPVAARGRKLTTRIQTVFQDPFASLDPRMRIGETIPRGRWRTGS